MGSVSARAQPLETVRVLGYIFPPFVNVDARSGLTFELIKELNRRQDQFHFVFQLTSPNRRYMMFQRQSADLMLYEMPKWDWLERGIPVSSTTVLHHDAEVYIAQRQPGRDQRYFDRILDKQIAIFQGYHYSFADYNADSYWLKQHFDVLITDKYPQLIELVRRGRADIGVITKGYLYQQFAQFPALAKELLVSDRYDQSYQLRALVADSSPVTLEHVNGLLDQIRSDGTYAKILREQGVSE
ncbi:MAG: ABC transporter substrate-binding protein [Motiliproteus sp.]